MSNSLPYSLPQGRTPRPAIWADVPDEQWDDWRWQLAHRINTYEEFAQIINLTEEETAGLKAPEKFRVDITPYFASLIDPDDPDCPVRLQVVPRARELEAFDSMMEDSLSEDAHSPVPGLVHRYPDRVLMLVTTQCASYCRYCTRSRVVGDPHAAFFNRANYLKQLEYLRNTPQVRDVLLSGGDPLTLSPKILDELLAGLRDIPHIEIIRIGSRVPVFMPQRVTDEFVDTLRKYHPLWMNIHVNHPKEITPELVRACAKLADAGIPLGNQSVLLAGVNDHPETIKKLCHDLVKMRVRPYYLYMCDLVEGSGHFRTTVAAGLEIMEALRGHTSGYAVPTFAVDLPGGGGKVPVQPNYLLSQSHDRLVFRNFEGYISTYTEPTNYQRPKITQWVPKTRTEKGQRGVSALLAGEEMTIKPANWETLHQRDDEHEAREEVDVAELQSRRDVEIAPEGDGATWMKVN
jgi:lysine 2,3-aminomutase